MSISVLPTEILVKIFEYLSLKTLREIEKTCIRWSLIIIENFYTPFLEKQDFSVRKHYAREGWVNNASGHDRTETLFSKVYSELPGNWREGRFSIPFNQQITEFRPEEDRISTIAVYEDKVYFARKGSQVEVRDAKDLSLLRILNTDIQVENTETTRPCRICQHGKTLAVLGPNRIKVRLFNAETDEMVGEIETALRSPIYNIAMSGNLLILLAGWTIYYWRIDSNAPDRVRGQYGGCIPEYEANAEFQNVLEAHESVVNSRWLVTRATRMRIQAEGGLRMTHFLHARKVDRDGSIGPILRPESSRLPDTVYETTCMALSEGDMLAVGWRVMEEGVMTVMDLNTGDRIVDIQSQHFLSTIQIPLKWEGMKLFLKIIPVVANEYTSEEFGVSLGYLDVERRELVTIPGFLFENSEDILYLDKTQVIRVSTKLERLENTSEFSETDLNMELEKFALLNAEAEDYSPIFAVSVSVYDFWNSPDL